MPLAAGGEARLTAAVEIRQCHDCRRVVHLAIVQPGAAAVDQSPCLAFRGEQAAADQQVDERDAGGKTRPFDFDRRQAAARNAQPEGLVCGARRIGCRVCAIDNPPTNYNGMAGVETLKVALDSSVRIEPLDLDGRFRLPVELVDERFTSVEAEGHLRGRKAARLAVDSVAAQLILEQYLDERAA